MATATYLRVDTAKAPQQRITVQGSGRTVHVWRGNGATIRVAVFAPDGAVMDLGDHALLYLSYMPADRKSAAIATVQSAIVDAAFTTAEWEAGEKWHGEFDFSEADFNPAFAGLQSSYWLVCYGTRLGTGDEVTHGGATMTVEEDGTDNTVESPSPPDTGITPAAALILVESAVDDALGDRALPAGGTLGKWVHYGASGPEWQDWPNVMTDAGDMVVGGSEGQPQRLPKGTDGKVLRMVGGVPVWDDEASGMDNPMEGAGDIIIGGSEGQPQRLPKGTDGKILRMVDGAPVWDDEAGGGGSGGMANPMEGAGDIIIGGSGGAATRLAKSADGKVLKIVNGTPAWADETGGGGTNTLYVERSFGGGASSIAYLSGVVMVPTTNIRIRRIDATVADGGFAGLIQITVAGATVTLSGYYGLSGRYGTTVPSGSGISVSAGIEVSMSVTDSGEYMGSGAAEGEVVIGIEFERV